MGTNGPGVRDEDVGGPYPLVRLLAADPARRVRGDAAAISRVRQRSNTGLDPASYS